MKRGKGVRKIILLIIPILIGVLIILNFVPIKFAVKLEDAQKKLEIGRYICVTDYKAKVAFNTEWYASPGINSHLEEFLAVRVSGNSPNNYLSEREFESFEIENKFLLIGNVERLEEDEDYTYSSNADLNVDRWDIIYPIRRASFRHYFTPKSYLNIYDYDLIKALKTIWK